MLHIHYIYNQNVPAVVWDVCMTGTGPLGAAARTDDDIKFYKQKNIYNFIHISKLLN